MRIAVLCNDTRGGVEPYLALALALRQAGHDVRVVAPSDFALMFAESGIVVASLSGNMEEALHNSNGAAERGVLSSMRFAARELPGRILAWTRETLAACEGADILTGGIGGMVIGLSVAEKLGKPFIETHLQPVGAPTDSYPGILVPKMPPWLGSWGFRLSHHFSEAAFWMPFRGPMLSAREKVLGLRGPSRAVNLQPVLYGFSRHVVPVPQCTIRERHVTGYWPLPLAANWRAPPGLEEFLALGGPLVSIGFGSMASGVPAETAALVFNAVQSAGVRAVLLTGWSGIRTDHGNDRVFCVKSVPHQWLFPRMSAVVHHGGAGTTGAALRAGVPAVVVPFTMDQPFWASRVEALGVGPKSLPRRQLKAQALAAAVVQAVTDPGIRLRAAALGAAISAEDGLATAVRHFGKLQINFGGGGGT